MEVLMKDEREDIQKKTFAKWINSQLAKGHHPPVTDLFFDLRDGTRLLALLEVLTGRTYRREKGRMRVHHLNNVSRALAVLEEHGVRLINISNEHIVDGSAKLTLGLVWAVILHWQVQGVLKDVLSDLQQTNLEKTLLAWCRQTTKGYYGVDIRNFTTCWADGLAFNALLHAHRPQLFEWTVVARKHPYARLENAFRIANEHLGIERLLDPEDVNSQVPDKKSVMMYVMCLFQALPHDSFTVENLDASLTSDASTTSPAAAAALGVEASGLASPMGKGRPLSTASIGLGGYQRTLEEVLSWLLGAEDRLAAMPPIADTTDAVKDQFHDLEELMLDLTSKQGGIGDVLGEGSRLLREGVMEEEEEEEVRVQMKLLNTRWEELRVRAMDRQSRLHERLMSLQQRQLEGLKKWLTETEDRIANMSQVGPTTEALKQQVAAHQQLQHDLEAEQSNINSLSNMVVVVDEASADSVYSTLEDELNALGERWAHICRWTESRWSTLQTLNMYWPRFEDDMERLREWVDAKGKMLRQFESEPVTEEGQVLRHASALQVLEAEMEAQQQRFDILQDHSAKILIHIPEDSPPHSTLPAQLEDVQDSLDLLTSMMEAQTTRLAASGIDIKKVSVPVESGASGGGGGGGEVVRSSTTTITSKDATTTLITKVVTTKVTETVSGSSVKRQKMEGGSQEDFSVALTKLGEWMEGVEEKARSGEVHQLSLQQLTLLLHQLEAEMAGQQEEYSQVVSLGQSAISETSTTRESDGGVAQMVEGVVERWQALTHMLEEIRCRMSFVTCRDEVTDALAHLEKRREEVEQWMEGQEEEEEERKKREEAGAGTGAWESKLEEVEGYEVEAEGLRRRVEGVEERWAEERQALVKKVEENLEGWRKLRERLREKTTTATTTATATEGETAMEITTTAATMTLTTESAPQQPPSPLPQPQQPPEALLKAIAASREWLEGLGATLGSGSVPISKGLTEMEDRLARLKELQQKVESERSNMDHINSTCASLVKEREVTGVVEGCEGLEVDVARLSDQWEATTRTLKERIEAIEKAIRKVRQYEEEVCGLQSWLGEVEVFLGAEEAALGDVETLEAQLEQSNALQDDITTLRTNMENITSTGTQLVEEARAEDRERGGGGGGGGGEEYANTLRRRLDALTHRWETVTHMATLQNKSLKEALARSQKVHKDLQELNAWLDGVEGKIPPTLSTPATTDTTTTSAPDTTTTIETPEQLTTAAATFQALREEVSTKAEDMKALNRIGDEMLQADSAATHEELARSFTQVNGRWTEVVSRVDDGHKRMSEAAQRYEEFRRLCGEEEAWLGQLEGMLQGSSRDAVDAEEISEALDALDLFLHTHDEGRLEVIRQLGEGLVGVGCVVGDVTRTTTTLTQRFSTLNAQARERQTGLEGRIQEAQAWEREYVGVLDHLSQADSSLSQALTDGVMLLDLAVVESELVGQVEVLERMRTQVEVYRGEGKGEAAGRLEDQVTHLQRKYEEVEMKLRLCQKPADYDERLQRTEAQLLEVRGAVAALTLTSPDPDAIQEQLTQCMALYQTLSDVKGEVEEVIARGRRIVKEGHCADPEDLTAHLDRVKALYNQLGGAVTEQRGALERAVRHVRKLGKECAQLEEWLGGTEAELDQREAAVPTQNLQAEAHFVQHALEDLSRRRPQLVGLQEGLTSLLQQDQPPTTTTTTTPTTAAPTSPALSPSPLEERVADLAHIWERVTTRLNNRLVNIQSEQAVKEGEMETFIVGLGEVKGWLESTEAQLATLPTLPTQEQERLVKAVSGEAQRYKGQIRDIRSTSEALVRHGVLFQARVTPELDEINDRWERIYATLQRQEAIEEEMSVERTFVREKQSFSTSSTSSTITTTTTISTTTTSSASPVEEKDEVEEFLREVTRMSDKVTALTHKTQTPPPYQLAQARLEALEQEVGCLEPDVATVISRGDTLTLKTHSINVQRAHNIRLAVNDLRAQWSALKTRTEGMKQEVSRVCVEVDAVSGQADSIIAWCNDVSKRLHLLNNDESQLGALEVEMAQRRQELDALNESGALLRKYQYTQIQPVLTLLNMRWTEIAMQFRQYRKGSMEKKAFVEDTKITTTTTTTTTTSPPSPSQLLATIGRVREGVSATAKHLSSPTLATLTPYTHLKAQEEELKSIKESLATLKPRVDAVEEEREAIGRGGGGGGGGGDEEAVRRVGDKLREEWAQVNRGYTDRHNRWLQCSETLTSLHHTLDDFCTWLTSAEEKVAASSTQPLTQNRLIQKELEKQVTLKHRPSQSLQTMCKEVVEGQDVEEGRRLQERVDAVLKRWRALLVELAARRERITGEEGGKEGKKEAKEVKESITTTVLSSSSSAAAGKEGGGEVEGLAGWVEQVEALMAAPVNVTDEASLSAHSTMVQNHVLELPAKQTQLQRVKEAKMKGVTQGQLATLEAGLDKVARTLPDYKRMVETKLGVIQTLGKEVEELYRWTEEVRVKVALRNLSEEEVRMLRGQIREREAQFEALDSTYWVLAQDVEAKGLTVAVALKNRISTIETRLKMLQAQMSEVTPAPTPPRAPHAEEGAKGGAGGTAAPPVGSTVTPNVTSVIKDVMKLEECVLREGQEMRPPSPLVCPPRHPPDSSPVLILASLDKSILQIRDWLTLMEQMSRQQTVVVGDAEDIRRLTEKQKNVLRELEGKKPQLDELVSSADGLKEDASRTQLHQKVSKLREHWDETNSVVLARKTQLDAMYSDTHKFDAKRAELESWLGRMEGRLERMAPVARTADVLDQQIREQKGFHAEIHQYKHQLELFNQMTQRLIAIYQHDDTRRLKKITETINFRYSSLNASIIARGKELHSAINSLHNFDKALDKFASWMSEMESGSEMLEGEVDKLGPPPPASTSSTTAASSSTRGHLPLHHPQRAGPTLHLKDLQSEIESHKDVLASLNATGQKLLGTLENQEEAVMLQRRLEEMNHRWNTLKHKSIAIRNRLEGNSENWTTLLLSLRELIEWVIRKDTELTALGPLVGDPAALTKYAEDLASFRRVIEEKQPVIESNLKSGRQLIASEPPLSDTSDSEAGRELDGDARYRGDETARDLTRAVRREVAKLSEKWAALRERVAATTTHTELAHKKLGVLSKTVEEVSGRLEEAERVVEGWGGTIPQDPNLADQHAHNVKKFREGLVDLQRGVDDVNDQAARFSAHSVPLTPANSARLHELNTRWKNLESTVNDRWRQVAGRSREVTPLTPAQLASSVAPPWERATTTNKVPYYINHEQESTHWDHPTMMDVLDSLTEFNHIKFSAYRTATKLRVLQKKLALDKAKMQTATDIFDEHGLRGQNDRLIDVGDMVVVLSALYGTIAADHPDVDTTLAMDLCLNWLLNVYDSQRTGQMRVLSFKIGLVCLCTGHLEEKYRYMFRLIADPNRLVDQRKLGLLLHDCVQVPRQLGEVAAFGGSNIEPSVRSCFTKAGKDRDTIEAVHFLAWVQQEPQSLVWLAVLHRVAASESIQHQVKCNICKAYPIIGLRYRCLKCLSFDMCQDCFFDGRSGKSHKITHPMHEYCTATTAGEDVKDFTKALKNKFKSKRSLQKHTKKGYLPVQTVLEGDPLESPSPSPQHNVTSQDMHSRLEMYASRLAEVELRTNSNSTPDSEDEHGLIAQYCQSLSSSDAPLPVPRSPLQIMAAVDADQKDELEQMIRALEEENSVLQAEYDRLKSQQPVGSPPEDGLGGPQRSEAEMLAEAKLLRQHKGRLEARMGILEEHNRQLEAQLHRLRQLLGESGLSSPSKSGTLQTKSVTASQLAMDSPAKVNGHSAQGELGKAVGTLVATMTQEQGSDLPSEEEDEEEEEEEEEKKEEEKPRPTPKPRQKE